MERLENLMENWPYIWETVRDDQDCHSSIIKDIAYWLSNDLKIIDIT